MRRKDGPQRMSKEGEPNSGGVGHSSGAVVEATFVSKGSRGIGLNQSRSIIMQGFAVLPKGEGWACVAQKGRSLPETGMHRGARITTERSDGVFFLFCLRQSRAMEQSVLIVLRIFSLFFPS